MESVLTPNTVWSSSQSSERPAKIDPISQRHIPVRTSSKRSGISGAEHQLDELLDQDYDEVDHSLNSRVPRLSTLRLSLGMMLATQPSEADNLSSVFRWSRAVADTAQVSLSEWSAASTSTLSYEYPSDALQRMMSRRRPIGRRRFHEVDCNEEAVDETMYIIPEDASESECDDMSISESEDLEDIATANDDETEDCHISTLPSQVDDNAMLQERIEAEIAILQALQVCDPSVTFKDTNAAIEELYAHLGDARLIARDIGIAIARSRAREDKERSGDAEGLWSRSIAR